MEELKQLLSNNNYELKKSILTDSLKIVEKCYYEHDKFFIFMIYIFIDRDIYNINLNFKVSLDEVIQKIKEIKQNKIDLYKSLRSKLDKKLKCDPISDNHSIITRFNISTTIDDNEYSIICLYNKMDDRITVEKNYVTVEISDIYDYMTKNHETYKILC